jgi:NADH:ubiquinone oxidoreductase subunit 6 (subunit J)
LGAIYQKDMKSQFFVEKKLILGAIYWSKEIIYFQNMDGNQIFQYAAIFVILAGAAGVLLFKKIIHSATALLASLLGAAFFMLSLKADTAAWSQVMAYAGGVVVLIVFAVFFTNPAEEQKNIRKYSLFFLGLTCLFFVFFSVYTDNAALVKPLPAGGLETGGSLFGEFMLVFELIAVLLTIVLAGVAEILRPKT